VQACGYPLIDAMPQPGEPIVGRRKYNLMLKDMVQIHVPPAKPVERGDGSTMVVFGDEILLV
jgi:hypothetical protein